MSLISWNCQGLGNPWTVRSLHDLVKENNPSILFLMETRMKAIEVEGIVHVYVSILFLLFQVMVERVD